MLKSIINGATTTPTQLAKEIVFYHGEYAVIAPVSYTHLTLPTKLEV